MTRFYLLPLHRTYVLVRSKQIVRRDIMIHYVYAYLDNKHLKIPVLTVDHISVAERFKRYGRPIFLPPSLEDDPELVREIIRDLVEIGWITYAISN
jgi:hypothetical protein